MKAEEDIYIYNIYKRRELLYDSNFVMKTSNRFLGNITEL
jgi:hypothetical protein